jgi:hypothetical protein
MMYFPPAERAWFSIAARVSDLTGLRLDLAVVLMTGVAVLISTSLAYRIRRETVGASPLFFVLPVAVLVILPILFKNVFGLREHMVALGLWPYLVLRVSDPDGTRIGWRTRVALGLWMGAMLLFKYLYSIVVFLVELTDAVAQRRPFLLFRIENLIAGAIVALYLFCWLVLDPGQRTVIGAVVSAIDANLADPRANWLQVATNSVTPDRAWPCPRRWRDHRGLDPRALVFPPFVPHHDGLYRMVVDSTGPHEVVGPIPAAAVAHWSDRQGIP